VKPSLYVAVIDKCRTDRQGMSEQIVDQRELTMSVLMTPDMANFSGNVRGGVLLKLLDQVAYACASRYAGCYVVTLSVDQVAFKQPIHVGRDGHFLRQRQPRWPHFDGGGHQGCDGNILERRVHHTNSCYFTMVAYDSKREGHTTPSPFTCHA
jgi:acyl-CoA hydrolase